MKVLVLAPLKDENFKKIEKEFPELIFKYGRNKTITQKDINECDIIIGNPSTKFDLYKDNIQAILLNSAGSDNYVKEGLLHPNTQLANASGTYGKAIAEHAIGMILMLNKNFKQYVKQMEKHQWKLVKSGKEINQSTVVIVGLGDLGYQIAKRLKIFDCKIIGVKRRLTELPECIDELYTTENLNEVLPKADFVISALPNTPATYHLFNKETLMLMKKDAVLVNVGRGSAVDTNDLKEVLKSGHLYGVGLDVLEEEPLSSDEELWDFDNVFITPHSSGGYVWNSARQYYTDLVIRNLKHLLHHEDLENEVDFQTGYRKIIEYKL